MEMARKVVNTFKPNLLSKLKQVIFLFNPNKKIERFERVKFNGQKVTFKKASEPSDINWTGIGSMISKKQAKKKSNQVIFI